MVCLVSAGDEDCQDISFALVNSYVDASGKNVIWLYLLSAEIFDTTNGARWDKFKGWYKAAINMAVSVANVVIQVAPIVMGALATPGSVARVRSHHA